MPSIAKQIAAGLEGSFTANGFAEPGVDALRDATGVSLRTLYRHFPSREAMIIGALDHRHRAYLAYLAERAPDGPGPRPVLHLYERLGEWMTKRAPKGCLFVNALAAHPESRSIRDAVERHKRETREIIGKRVAQAAATASLARFGPLMDALFMIHEGQTTMAVASGAETATHVATSLASVCLANWGIE